MTCTLEHPVNWEEEQGRCNSATLPDSTAEQVLDILIDILSWEIAEVVSACFPRGL